MSQGLPPDVLLNLQAEYVSSLEEKARQLLDAFQTKNMESLKGLLHKLAGSGKTYSFAELSQLAREAEIDMEKKTTPDKGVEEHLFRVLREMRRIKTLQSKIA